MEAWIEADANQARADQEASEKARRKLEKEEQQRLAETAAIQAAGPLTLLLAMVFKLDMSRNLEDYGDVTSADFEHELHEWTNVKNMNPNRSECTHSSL